MSQNALYGFSSQNPIFFFIPKCLRIEMNIYIEFHFYLRKMHLNEIKLTLKSQSTTSKIPIAAINDTAAQW